MHPWGKHSCSDLEHPYPDNPNSDSYHHTKPHCQCSECTFRYPNPG
jgi:hypothetical protein